jgi:hypothetical protein
VAEDLAERGPVRATVERATEAPKEETQRPVHRRRFLIAYLVLGVVFAVAAAGGFMLLWGAERAPGQDWSDWRPSGDESTYRDQIAAYVGRRYRLPSGNQLVGVVALPPEVGAGDNTVPIRAVAIQRANAASNEDIDILPAEDSLMYRFCGRGEGCLIGEGEPTPEHHRLLRREALELALYTFRYVDGVDSVVAFLPPSPTRYAPVQQADGQWRIRDTKTGELSMAIGSSTEAEQITERLNPEDTALFFQKRHFETELDRPLRETLTRTNAPAVTVTISPIESIKIDRLTRPRLFAFDFEPLREGSVLLVLGPLRATP